MNHNTAQRIKRHRRVRKRINGTSERPRLAVFKSNRHLYAQLIDDIQMRTVAAASSLELRKAGGSATNSIETAEQLGKLVAERAMAKGLTAAVFDRGGFRFHGKVRALAEGARRQGLAL